MVDERSVSEVDQLQTGRFSSRQHERRVARILPLGLITRRNSCEIILHKSNELDQGASRRQRRCYGFAGGRVKAPLQVDLGDFLRELPLQSVFLRLQIRHAVAECLRTSSGTPSPRLLRDLSPKCAEILEGVLQMLVATAKNCIALQCQRLDPDCLSAKRKLEGSHHCWHAAR